MTNFGEIPFTDEAKEMILNSVATYRRYGVEISFFPDFVGEERILRVNIRQAKVINEKVLNSDELVDRAYNVFKDFLTPEYPVIISTPEV